MIIRAKISILFLLLLVSFQRTKASNTLVDFKAEVDKNQVVIGESLHLTLSLNINSNISKVDWVKISEQEKINGMFEVLQVDSLQKNEKAEINYKQTFTLTCFDTGFHVITPFNILVGDSAYETQPILIEVNVMDVDTTKAFTDIKPILTDDLTFSDRMQLFLQWCKKNPLYVILFALLLTGLIFLIVQLRTKKANIEEIKPKIPYYQLALNQLKELDDKKLWQNNNQKQYHIELTNIVRSYIRKRFNIQTHEKTTHEIMQSLRFANLSKTNTENLQKLLMLSDLVKFAKEKPLPEENIQLMNNAINLIETTKIIDN